MRETGASEGHDLAADSRADTNSAHWVHARHTG
jgi:hypothetical protein